MRLGKIAWLVLGIGAFVIIAATLLVVYLGKSGEEKEIADNLATAETQLTNLIAGKETSESQLAELQSKLAQAKASLSRTQAIFPELTENIEYDEVLAELAQDCNLEVMRMAATEPNEEEAEVEGVIYMVLSFEVEVRGEVSDMLRMVHAIAIDERLITAGVELADIKVPQVAAGAAPQQPLGIIQFTGYSYPRE